MLIDPQESLRFTGPSTQIACCHFELWVKDDMASVYLGVCDHIKGYNGCTALFALCSSRLVSPRPLTDVHILSYFTVQCSMMFIYSFHKQES